MNPFLLLLPVLCVLVLPTSADAQMVTGDKMTNFKKVFDIKENGFTATQTACSLGPNILLPGDEAEFTFFLKSGTPYKGKVLVDVMKYGTRATKGDMWTPIVFKIEDIGRTEVEVDIPAEGGYVTVKPKIGDKFGGYALIINLGAQGRAFGATCVRVPKPEPGRERLPTFALDIGWPDEMTREVYQTFKRLGVKGARVEGGYGSIGDAHVDWAMENDIALLLTVGVAKTPMEQMPLGRGRPWLNADGTMKEKVKEDLVWLPSFDPEFKKYLKNVVKEHGWPKGPINAVELWNEPWEALSISGWAADIPRYRELYQVMAEAVSEARKEGNLQVLIGGTCSSSNTRDKLFPDGKDTFLPYLDFVSIHYQPLAADPALVPEFRNRKGEYGRVQVRDTESWVANSEDKVAGVIASMRAMGQDRAAGIYRGNVFESQQPEIGEKKHAVVQVWSPGAAVAASQQFIGQRPFKEILFKNGLPWTFVFGSRKDKSEDGSVVIVGDLAPSYSSNRTLFRSVALEPSAKMTLSDGGGRFILYDFYGNSVPSVGGKIQVPLNALGYFLRADGSPGSFDALLKEIAGARLDGVQPVEIVAHDLQAAVTAKPAARITLTNVLNRPITGKLKLAVDGLTLDPGEQAVALAAHETRDFSFTVSGGNADAANNYKLLANFESEEGSAKHAEVIHANVISRRRIEVDGERSDWKDALPQAGAQKVGVSEAEKAYLPFLDWKQSEATGQVTGWMAADADFFYFAAEVPKIEGMPRFETRDDDSYFYPEKVRDGDKELTWPQGVRRFSYAKDFEIPSGNGKHNVQIAFNAIPVDQEPWLAFPDGTMPRFCAYLDTDYEFALNKVDDAFGGGTEIFCLQRPGMPRKHFFPRQPKSAIDGGPVKEPAKLVVNGNFLECALPWSAIPHVKERLDSGLTIKFSFRVNQGDNAFELAAGRSASKENPYSFHDDWTTHWANELEFTLEK